MLNLQNELHNLRGATKPCQVSTISHNVHCHCFDVLSENTVQACIACVQSLEAQQNKTIFQHLTSVKMAIFQHLTSVKIAVFQHLTSVKIAVFQHLT